MDYLSIATTNPESNTVVKTEEYVSTINQTVTPAPADVTHFSNGMDDVQFKSVPLVQELDSFPTDAPNEMMARVRKLPFLRWQTSEAIDTTTTINIANELLISLSAIVNYSNWTFFKYDHILVRLTLNTSRFFKGAMLVTTVPGSVNSVLNLNYHAMALSTLPSSILDATATETLEIIIPWYTPLVKEGAAFFNTNNTGFLAFNVLSVLTSETALGVDVNADISIEACFVNPQLINPYPNGFPVPTVIPRVEIPATTFNPYFTQGRGKRMVVAEASKKAEKGTLTSIAETTSSIASSLTKVPIIGPFAEGISIVSSAASSFFDWMGLSKPGNVTTPQFVTSMYNPFSQTFHGVVTSQPMSADLLPYVSTDPHLVADHVDGCNLMKIATTPSIISNTQILPVVNNTPVFCSSIAVSPQFGYGDPTKQAPSNSGYVSSFFGAWRGEMAYKIYVPASLMSRQRIILTHTITRPSTWSEVYRSQYYEIQGSTVIDITLPWIRKEPYLPLTQLAPADSNPNSNGYLTVWAATALINDNPGVTPLPLRTIIFVSATPATQFAVFRSPLINKTVFSTFLQGSFGAKTSAVLDSVICEDDITSLREIAHRPMGMGAVPIDAGGVITMPRTFPQMFKYLLSKFRFARGSLNVQYSYLGNVAVAPNIYICRYTGTYEDTTILWNPRDNPTMVVTLPFDAPLGYYSTGSTDSSTEAKLPFAPILNIPVGAVPAKVEIYLFFSDDFSLGVQTFSPYTTN